MGKFKLLDCVLTAVVFALVFKLVNLATGLLGLALRLAYSSGGG